MSLPAVRRLTHSSPRTLARISVSRFSFNFAPRPSTAGALPISRALQFSTMTAYQSAAPAAPTDKSYDPEIRDMANYIHEYKIDSDLAVSLAGQSITLSPGLDDRL